MRDFVLFAFMICSTLTPFAQGAQDYVNNLTSNYADLQNDFLSYSLHISGGRNAFKYEKQRKDLVRRSEEVINAVNEIKPFEGGEELIESVVDYLSVVTQLLKEDYAEIALKEPEIDTSLVALENYIMLRANALESHADVIDQLNRAKMIFSQENEIFFGNSVNLDDEILAAGQVFNYYNEVFMVYFASQLVEDEFIAVLKGDSIQAIVASKKSFRYKLDEQLGTLDSFEPYKGDTTIVEACKATLEFFMSQANDAQLAIEFLKKKRHFEKVENRIESKNKKEITDQDMNDLAEAEENLKIAKEAFYQKQEENDKARISVKKEWEKTSEAFIDTYFPERK